MSKTFRGNEREKYKKNFLKFKKKRLKRTIVDEPQKKQKIEKESEMNYIY